MHKKKVIAVSLGIILSAILLFILFQNIEWGTFVREIQRVEVVYLAPLLGLFYLSFWLRALRWFYLLPGSKEKLPTSTLNRATLLGFFGTCILPLRAGEIIRPWVLSRWSGVSFSSGLASIVTERVFDVLGILAFLAVALANAEHVPEFVSSGAFVLLAICLIVVLAMLLSYLQGERLQRFAEWIFQAVFARSNPKISESLTHLVGEFIAGLRAIRGFKDLAICLGLTFLLWLCWGVFYWVGILAFGVSVGLEAGIVVMVLVALAVAAPSAPGFLGTFQLGCVAALTGVYGYSQEFSLAYSVVLHSFQVLLAVISGVYILKTQGLGLSTISHVSEVKEA